MKKKNRKKKKYKKNFHVPYILNSNKGELFEGSFFWGVGGRGYQFDFPFIFQEELIQHQYNFIKLLNNLFEVGWR